jgi:hypothetical protein
MSFVEIAVACSGLRYSSSVTFICDVNGNSRNGEKGLKFHKPVEVLNNP